MAERQPRTSPAETTPVAAGPNARGEYRQEADEQGRASVVPQARAAGEARPVEDVDRQERGRTMDEIPDQAAPLTEVDVSSRAELASRPQPRRGQHRSRADGRTTAPPPTEEGADAPSRGTVDTPGRPRRPARGRPEVSRRRGPIVDPRRPSGGGAPRTLGRGQPGVEMGTISELSRRRGFGFLVDAAGRRRFFHRSAVVGVPFDALREQQMVQFEPREDAKGLRADNVRPASAGLVRSAGSGRVGGPGTRSQAGGSRPGAGRSPSEGGAASQSPTWRSSLSPFRGEPPTAPPRRRR
jgi:cold shock CspA family protein